MEAAFGHVLEGAPELGQIPFHVGDARSAPLVARDPDLSWNPWRKPEELKRLLWSLSTGKPGQPVYNADSAMYREAQADLVDAKIRLTRNLGAEVIQLNTLRDWKIGGSLIAGSAGAIRCRGW